MQEVVSIGASPKADMQISGSNIAEQHAEISQKYNRTYCKALAGDEQDVTSSSYTWLDDSESSLRTGKLLTAAGYLLLLLRSVLSSREMHVHTICRLYQPKPSFHSCPCHGSPQGGKCSLQVCLTCWPQKHAYHLERRAIAL